MENCFCQLVDPLCRWSSRVTVCRAGVCPNGVPVCRIDYMVTYFTPVRMGKTNNPGNKRCRRGCGERGTLLHSWWECKLVQSLWKTVWRILKQLKRELTTLWPSSYKRRFLPKGQKTTESKGYKHPNVYTSIINNSQTMERAQTSINWWMGKEEVVYGGIWLSHQNGAILPFSTMWMDLECILLTK